VPQRGTFVADLEEAFLEKFVGQKVRINVINVLKHSLRFLMEEVDDLLYFPSVVANIADIAKAGCHPKAERTFADPLRAL